MHVLSKRFRQTIEMVATLELPTERANREEIRVPQRNISRKPSIPSYSKSFATISFCGKKNFVVSTKTCLVDYPNLVSINFNYDTCAPRTNIEVKGLRTLKNKRPRTAETTDR